MNIRPYQERFINAIRDGITKHKRVIACAATGSGKTIVFINIIKSALNKGRTVLVITEDTRIFGQIDAHHSFIPIQAGCGSFYIKANEAYLAMAQTLQRRPEMIKNFAHFGDRLLVICDEAHIGTATKILHTLPQALLIGFTATPDYKIAKHLPGLYNECVVGPQPDELVQAGFLAPYKHFCRTSAKLDTLRVQNGEYTEESQEQVFSTTQLFADLLADLRKFSYTKCSLYTSSIKHCDLVWTHLNANNIPAVRYHSGMPEAEASYNLGMFRDGSAKLMISVGSLTKGFDMPSIDFIVLYLATKSLAKYLQICGRGSRPNPGKKFWQVLDYGGNGIRHQGWDFERDWASMWNAIPKREGQGVAPIKLCPKCDFMMAASLMVCPNCGYKFPHIEKQVGETKIIELTEKYRALVGKRIAFLTAEELALYAKVKNKATFATRIAMGRELEKSGYIAAFGKAMGYKYTWPNFIINARMPKGYDRLAFYDSVFKNNFELK